MHKEATEFIKIVKDELPSYFIGRPVLEVGSFNVNGTIRTEFEDADYTGIDLVEGPDVDIVGSGHEIKLDRKFDVVISMECMEHNPHFIETIENMLHHCSDEGIVIITAASIDRPEHGTSRTDPDESPGTSAVGWDYYKNLRISDIIATFEKNNNFKFRCYYNYLSNDLYILAIGSKAPQAEHAEEKFYAIQQHLYSSFQRAAGERYMGALQYYMQAINQSINRLEKRMIDVEKKLG